MQFTIPQFIEHEPKIVGPFTFRQFMFIGGAGIFCIILYFSLGKTNFLLFLLVTFVLILVAISFAFFKVGGRNLVVILKNVLSFSVAPKIYLWRRKEIPPKVIKITEKKAEKEEEAVPTLKFAEKSRLKKLSNQIESRT